MPVSPSTNPLGGDYDLSIMVEVRFALFPTPIGRCAIAWSDVGVTALYLPDNSIVALRARVRERCPGAIEAKPSGSVTGAIAQVTALLEGAPAKLTDIVLDMRGTPQFHRQVYELARRIPPGSTLSYGDLATRLGKPYAARAVGQALGRNPWALIVPCHRVVAANGKLTGFSAPGGIATKRRLLQIEGCVVDSN